MTELLSIIINVISPVFIIIGIAFVISRNFNPDPRAISLLLIYVFLPALAFRGTATTDVPGDEIGGIVAMAVIMLFIMMGIGLAISRMLKLDARAEGAFVLSVMMVNAANYGIPLNTFAFGQEGTERAIVYWLAAVMLGNVVGIFFASRGSAPWQGAVMNVLKVPIAYATVAGLLVNVTDFTVPVPLYGAIDILADASIPCMITLLGLRLAKTRITGSLRPILIATGTKLLIAPMIAVPLALLLGLQGVAFNVAVVESSMPTAVVATAFAMEFGSDSDFTLSVTLLTTLLSIVTLSVLLLLLGGVG